jgi:hypothetical protein
MDTTVVITIGAVSLVALLSVWTSRTKSTSLPLPPGPRRIPFLGNALDVDITEPHLTYTQWGRQYGLSHAVNSFTAPTEVNLSRGHRILSTSWTGLYNCELRESCQNAVRRSTLCGVC